jgi:hypothetical protein
MWWKVCSSKTCCMQARRWPDGQRRAPRCAVPLRARSLAPHRVEVDAHRGDIVDALRFRGANDFFFLPLAMAAAKNVVDQWQSIEGRTLVTAIAFNGARAGIRMASFRQWFTAPVPSLHGAYFSGFGPGDAGQVIGDSEVMETFGLGALSMAAAPSLAPYVGGTAAQAASFTDAMYGITVGAHSRLRIRALDRRGAPLGIDVRKVVETRVPPYSTAESRPSRDRCGTNRCRLRACSARVFRTQQFAINARQERMSNAGGG